jgi:hypothetical protein
MMALNSEFETQMAERICYFGDAWSAQPPTPLLSTFLNPPLLCIDVKRFGTMTDEILIPYAPAELYVIECPPPDLGGKNPVTISFNTIF